MKKTFSNQFIKEHSGCYKSTEGKLEKVYTDNKKTCFNEKKCDVTLDEVLKSNIPVKDKYWFLVNNSFNTAEKQAIGIIGLDLFSKAFNKQYSVDSKFLKPYIKVAKDFINGEATLTELRNEYNIAYNSMSAVGRWVLVVVLFFVDDAGEPFGCYNAYYLLSYLSDYQPVSDKLFKAVIKFCK